MIKWSICRLNHQLNKFLEKIRLKACGKNEFSYNAPPVPMQNLIIKICRDTRAGIAQLVEHDLAKVGVASSSLVSRSKNFPINNDYVQHQLTEQVTLTGWIFFVIFSAHRFIHRQSLIFNFHYKPNNIDTSKLIH